MTLIIHVMKASLNKQTNKSDRRDGTLNTVHTSNFLHLHQGLSTSACTNTGIMRWTPSEKQISV